MALSCPSRLYAFSVTYVGSVRDMMVVAVSVVDAEEDVGVESLGSQ